MEQKGVGKKKTCIMAAAQEFDTTVVCCTRQFWVFTWERGQKHLEREEERLSGTRSSHEKKASLPPPLSLLTLLQEDCGNPHEEKVKSIPWKSRFIPFFPGLTQGTSWYQVSEFCFPKVLGTQDTDIIPVVEILPLTPQMDLPARNCSGPVSAGEGQLKNLGFYLLEVPKLFSFGRIESLISESQC